MNRMGFVLTVALAAAFVALGPVPANAALPSLPGVSPGSATAQYIPKDSSIVVGVNVEKLAEGGVFDTLEGMGGEEMFGDLEEMGIDLTEDVSEVMVGLVFNAENPEAEPGVYFALYGELPSAEEVLKFYEESTGETPESRTVEGKTVYNFDGEADVCVLPGAILVAPTGESYADIGKMLAGTEASVLSNPKIAALMKDVNTKASIWGVASLPEAVRQAMAEDGEGAPVDLSALETICGSFDLGETAVDLSIACGFTNAETAQQVLDWFNMQVKPMGEQMAEMMPEVATLINALKMEAADTKATLTMKMGREEFDEAIEGLLAMMFGAMMMEAEEGEEAEW
jgi:hypothetical protein